MEPGTTAGAQTLARGLSALEMVATAENGMTVQEAAERLGVHRTIASRLLGALARHRPRARGERPACVLLITVDRQLAESALPAVTDAARQVSALLA